MFDIKRAFCDLIGTVYIPKELLEWKEEKLLHISDTPSLFYPELKRLIYCLKPEWIVHTGDMVDNIKLGLYPGFLAHYEKHIKQLAGILETGGSELIIALGNHDDRDVVGKYFKEAKIIEVSAALNIGGKQFGISHYAEELMKVLSDYNLFGHDLTLESGCSDGRLFFNGISSINIIGLDSGNCYCLNYPAGTDNARMGKGKVGL